ncbi:halovibrin HvnC [Pseudomonas sp. COW5]|uniref:halovibrin HvnC n=1 Tax=Pseudomonas sp. COW5 TaxID=2981253 RepID=UPI0022478F13|nr:halovibrin HvnC [Pseudomonas sp. COW5]MCX2546472.1 halovibrin HvnC [Pseudomonas sp. COW5]
MSSLKAISVKHIVQALLIAIVLGCTQVDTQSTLPRITSNNPHAAMTGPQVVELLNTLYNRQFPNCDKNDNRPAFLCSGIIFRVTDKNPGDTHHVWNPSPTSVKNGGVSFSYLRADSKFGRLAWGKGNGFMLYPIFGAPWDKVDLDVLCSFPIDGWTWNRTTPCGPYVSFPATSQRCQSAGVATAEQWKNVWDTSPDSHHLRQCGFDVSEATGKPAGVPFYQSVRARGMLSQMPAHFSEQNEIVIKTWPQNLQDTFPLMAFFFIAGGTNAGLAEAQGNQKDFYDSTTARIWVPVIRLFPPSTPSAEATFQYVESDQLVKP